MITGTSSLFNNPYEDSIQQLLQIEQQKKVQLENQQETLQNQKTALSDIDSNLSSLDTLLSSFVNSPEEQTSPLTGTSSNPEAVDIVSTSGMDGPNNFTIDVGQVAKRDIMLSDEVTATNTDYNANGTGSFDIAVGTDQTATINVDTAGLNNQEVMEAVATEVNNQLGDHVTASVIQPQDGTAQLSFKSTETGKASRISVTNQQNDLAGMNFGSVHAEDDLNAEFTFDGANFERSSNLVDDAVNGLSFEIQKETAATESIEVSRDIEGAKENIQSFVNSFNEVNSIIREKTFLDGDSGERGPLQDERRIRNLSLNLRQNASLPVDSLSDSPVQNLSNIGIEMAGDGTMSIADENKLTDALTNNSEEVTQLFSADDGIATSLQQQINLHIGNGSVFDSIEDGFDRKIDRLDDRIAREEDYLVRKEEELRDEFNQLQQVISDGEQQFNSVLNFQNQMGF